MGSSKWQNNFKSDRYCHLNYERNRPKNSRFSPSLGNRGVIIGKVRGLKLSSRLLLLEVVVLLRLRLILLQGYFVLHNSIDWLVLWTSRRVTTVVKLLLVSTLLDHPLLLLASGPSATRRRRDKVIVQSRSDLLTCWLLLLVTLLRDGVGIGGHGRVGRFVVLLVRAAGGMVASRSSQNSRGLVG